MSNKFKPGDKVQFIDDNKKGHIVKILENNHVCFWDEDTNMKYPVSIKELMLIPTNKTEYTLPTPINQPNNRLHTSIDLTLTLSANDKTKELEFFFVNDSPYSVSFQCFQNINNNYQKVFSGILEAYQKIHLISFKPNVLKQINHFLFQGFIILENFKKPFPLIDKKITLSQQLSSVNFDKGIVYPIFHSDFSTEISNDTRLEIKNEKDKETTSKYKQNYETIEVDLHIDNIIENTVGLSNGDMLDIQLKYFQEKLEQAINNHFTKHIIFIHGKGKGVLKNLILEKLHQKYPHLHYRDASYKKYGSGATMVILK